VVRVELRDVGVSHLRGQQLPVQREDATAATRRANPPCVQISAPICDDADVSRSPRCPSAMSIIAEATERRVALSPSSPGR
jgi:hypothetical protein